MRVKGRERRKQTLAIFVRVDNVHVVPVKFKLIIQIPYLVRGLNVHTPEKILVREPNQNCTGGQLSESTRKENSNKKNCTRGWSGQPPESYKKGKL
jgi:hypothetical protein